MALRLGSSPVRFAMKTTAAGRFFVGGAFPADPLTNFAAVFTDRLSIPESVRNYQPCRVW
jgi:hypothetical protein